MNRKQLEKLGVPPACVPVAIRCLSTAAEKGTGFGLKGKRAKESITALLADASAFADDVVWADFAKALADYHAERAAEPIARRCDTRRGSAQLRRTRSIRARTSRCGKRAASRRRLALR